MKKMLVFLLMFVIALNSFAIDSFNGTTLVGNQKFQMKDITLENLELGKNYKITFDLTKDAGVKLGYVAVFKYLDKKQQEIYNEKLLTFGSYGEKNPCNGETYNGTIIVKIPDVVNMNKGVRLALYNKHSKQGAKVVINNLKISEVINNQDFKVNLAPVEATNPITLIGGGAAKFLYKNFNVTTLKPNTDYILSVNIKKVGNPKQAVISLLYRNEAKELTPIFNRVGGEVVSDGDEHLFEQEFTTPSDISRGIELYFYNNYTDDEVTFSDLSIREL